MKVILVSATTNAEWESVEAVTISHNDLKTFVDSKLPQVEPLMEDDDFSSVTFFFPLQTTWVETEEGIDFSETEFFVETPNEIKKRNLIPIDTKLDTFLIQFRKNGVFVKCYDKYNSHNEYYTVTIPYKIF